VLSWPKILKLPDMIKTIITFVGAFCLGGGALFVFESMRKISRIRDWIKGTNVFHNICQSRGYYHEEEEKKLRELLYYWGLIIIMLGVILNIIANRL